MPATTRNGVSMNRDTTAPPRASITLSGIARLARVQRPVVSMWRSRAADTESPFPAPIAHERGQPRFDVAEIAQWIADTHRGNNADVIADAAAFARLSDLGRGGDVAFDALTACIALSAAAGRPLGDLDVDDLLDLADAVDPDDVELYRELERVGDDAVLFARFADRFVDAAYDHASAFERAMDERFREGQTHLVRGHLSTDALDLIAALALDLASSMRGAVAGVADDLAFADPFDAASDVLVAIAKAAPEHAELTVSYATSIRGAGRAAAARDAAAFDSAERARRTSRRRARTHGMRTAFGTAPCVHVAPLPLEASTRPQDLLAAVGQLIESLGADDRAIVVGPASALIDDGLDVDANVVRNAALRSGCVRAMVRLPRGLVTSSPRQALALWVLAPAQRLDPGDRWALTVDLTGVDLTPDVRQDLVSDIASAVEPGADVRMRQLRFGAVARLATAIAAQRSLVHRATVQRPRTADGRSAIVATPTDAASRSAYIDALVAELGGEPTITTRVRPSSVSTRAMPLETLVRAGRVRVLPGTRLDAAELGRDGGFAVIGIDELRAPDAPGRVGAPRTVDRLSFVERHPRATITEPGDVIVEAARGRAWAMVDRVGANVVEAPARIIRLVTPSPGTTGVPAEEPVATLDPDVLAADVRAASGTDWRRWLVREVPISERDGLRDALAGIRAVRDEMRARLATLDHLELALTDAVASGDVTLTRPEGAA